MANRNGTSPGRVPRFEGTAQVGTKLPEMPMDHGAGFAALGKMFASLGAEVSSLADQTAKREGEAEGLDAGRAAMEEAKPLALRNDGTLRGEAADKAAIEAYSWRYATKVRNDLGDLYEQTKDDPTAWKQGLDKLRAEAAADPTFADPRMREVMGRTFEQAATPYHRSVVTRREARLEEERTAAAEENWTSTRGDVERKAYLAGADPVSGETLAEEVRKARATLDARVADGTLSPLEAQRRKAALERDTVRGRILGAFDALPSPDDQAKFASGISARWASNDPAFAGVDRAEMEQLNSHLHARARSNAADQRLDLGLTKQTLGDRLDADVASIRATGQPLEEGGGIDPVQVAKVLGPARAEEWRQRRVDAMAYHEATSDLTRLPGAEIAARVAALEPKAGAADFDRRKAIRDQVAKEAERIMKLRADDPARAVDEAVPGVRQAKADLDPAKPESFRKLAAMRLSVQSAIGIPALARQPLTDAEARAMMIPVTRAAPGQEFAAWKAIAPDIAARYGEHAPAVTRQLLEVTGVEKATATAGAALMDSLVRGRPDVRAARTLDTHAQADAATKAMAPKAVPEILRPVPARAIDKLRADPSLAKTFDEWYGAGAADLYLAPPKGGTTTMAPDGTEGWTP